MHPFSLLSSITLHKVYSLLPPLLWCVHIYLCACMYVCEDSLCTSFCWFARRAHRHTCLPCLSATPAISTGPLHSNFPSSAPCVGPLPPSLAMPPIWLEQRVQAGHASRSLSNAAEYSSSLGVSPPPLRPGLGPFNKEQVIQMEAGGSDSKGLVGGEDEFFLLLFFVSFFFYSSEGCVGSLPLSTYF